MFLLTEVDVKELNDFVCSAEKKVLSPEESEKSLQQNLVTLVYEKNGVQHDVGGGVRITKDIILTAYHNITPRKEDWKKVYEQKQDSLGFLSVADYSGNFYALETSFLFHSAEEQDLALVKGKGFSEIKRFNIHPGLVVGQEVYILARPNRTTLYQSEPGLVTENREHNHGNVVSYEYIAEVDSFPGCSGGAVVCDGALAGMIHASSSHVGPDGKRKSLASSIGMLDTILCIKEIVRRD
ncbi:MAG: serine protease [Nanoarchaeota archaeon]|nr:serine protease [Nanoarchaeota archaeon]